MSPVDEVLRAAESLEPNDRLRLIARLWAALPPEHWAAPSARELAEVERRLNDYDTGRTADVPWEIVRRILSNRPARTPTFVGTKIYSAPRRFDLATIFAVTAAYSLLLGGMSALRFPPILSAYVAAFITLVGVGQAVLFGGKKPRLASYLTGMAAYFLLGVISFSIDRPRFDIGEMIAFVMLFAVVFGGLLGYCAGVLVGGVFLVADVVRGRFGSPTGDDPNLGAMDEAPHPQKHPLDDAISTTSP